MRAAHGGQLAGGRGHRSRRGVLRLGLDDPRCRDSRLVGGNMAVFASVAGQMSVPQTEVLTAPVGLWGHPAWGPGAVSATRLGTLTEGPVSIRSWLLRPGRADTVVEPVWNNIDPAGLAEAVAEITAAAWRGVPGSGAGLRLVFAVQRFLPAAATALVLVRERRHVDVRLCWGLAESLGAPLHFDRFSFAGEPLQLERCAIADKYTATVAASGGTHSIRVPPRLVAAPVLALVAVAELAARGQGLAERESRPVELEFVLVGAERVLVSAHT